ncbi:hypothetical protein LPJ73_009359, partial [Coemansia sp. RSA 2703]
ASRAPLAALVLLSPRVNVVSRSGSWARNLHRDILPVFDWQTGSLAMLLSAADRVADDVFLAPVYAHWESAPRMLVQVGTGEVMLDDVREFVRRASREARVVYAEYQGAFHVFQAAPLGANGAGEAWRQAAADGTRQHAMIGAPVGPSLFVRAEGTRLWRDAAEYRVHGANYWQAMHLGMAVGPSANRTRVQADLARLRSLGITTVRLLAAAEGAAPHKMPLQ